MLVIIDLKKYTYILSSDRVLNIFKFLLLERPEVQHSWKAIVETWHLHWRGCSVILMIRGVIKGWLLRGKQGNLEFSFEYYAIYSSILLHSFTILQQHKVYDKICSSSTVLFTYKPHCLVMIFRNINKPFFFHFFP